MKKLSFFIVFSLVTFLNCLAESNESSDALNVLKQNVKFYKLDNGLRVIMYRRGTAPVFSGVVTVRVGGVDETVGSTGISHMLEHMAFKGTKQIGTKDYEKEKKLLQELEIFVQKQKAGVKPTAEDQKRFQEINLQLKELWILGDFNNEYDKRGSSEMNATTDKEMTNYFLSLPSSAFEFWCWMESERILNPVMRQFYQERDVVMEERRMRFDNDPQGKVYERLLSMVYSQHPYRNPVIGYAADIKSLTATMIENFHKAYYVPSNIVLSVVGDIDTDKDIKVIEKYFGRLQAGQAPAHPKIVEPPQEGEKRFTVEMKASPQIFIAYHKPNYPHADDAPLSIMSQILVGSNISPLYTELVKKRKIASSISHSEGPGQAYPNLLMFYAIPNNPYQNEDLLKVFDQVVVKFKADGVSEQDLEIAKRSIAMEYLAHLKSNMSLAKDFAESEAMFDNWKTSFDWYNEVMKVTAADVNRVAKQYLVNSSRTIAFLENNAAGSGAGAAK